MNTKAFSAKRLLSLLLAVAVMMTIVLPTNVFAAFSAATNGTISTDIETVALAVGEAAEFTVSTKANDDAGVNVIGRYEIDSDTAISKLEYLKDGNWITLEKTNAGDFGDSVGFKFEDATHTFRVTFAEKGTFKFNVSIVTFDGKYGAKLCEESAEIEVVEYADFTLLNEALENAAAYVASEYTAATYKALTEAVEAAEKAIDDKLTSDKQSEVDACVTAINDAIANLVETRVVEFLAVAVASDVTAHYAKADKVYLVFSEAIDNNPNLIADLKVGGEDAATYLADAGWVDNTIYEMDIIADIDSAEIEFVGNDEVFAVAGHALKGYATTIVGNLDEAYEYITATEMTATIVNVDDKPYMVDGDKIVLVFDAPVYGNPDTISVSEMEFTVVANTDNTIYVRELVAATDTVVAGQRLSYIDGNNTVIDSTLLGTFGGNVVPEIVRALAEDADGTAKTEGDKINVFFSAPTNKIAGAKETNFTGVLAGATGEWFDNQTLVITLATTPITVADKIDLSGLEIKDFYGVDEVDADEIALEGSFGVAIQPALLTITAISKEGKGAPSEGDEIYLAFNVKMQQDELNLQNDFVFNYGDYGTDASVAWAEGEEYAEYSTIVITLGKDANVVPGTTKVTIKKELFEESGIKSCAAANLENRIVAGTFGTSIAPSMLSASIVKKNVEVGSQPGDQIVLLFNVPTNAAEIIHLISVKDGNLGNNVEEGTWSNNNTIYTITLGDGASIENEASITFTNTDGVLKDINNQKVASTKTDILKGSFGVEAEAVGISPTSVTATIVKATNVANAQPGDQIVFAFNVATNGVDLTNYFKAKGIFGGEGLAGGWSNGNSVYTLTLGEGATITDNDVVEFTVEAGIKDVNEINGAVTITAGKFIGSFGTTIVPSGVTPKVLSATIVKKEASVGAQAGDEIVITFDMATNKASLIETLGGTALLGGGASGSWNESGNIYTVTLGEDSEVTAATVLKIKADAELKDQNEYSACVIDENIVLIGSFGEAIGLEVLSATAYSAKSDDGMSDYIDIEFNVDVVDTSRKTIFGATTETLFGSDYAVARKETAHNILTIKLGTNHTVKKGSVIVFSDQAEHLLASVDGAKLESAAEVVVAGELRKPMVTKIKAVNEGENGKLLVYFSSKTNEKQDIDFSSQSSSLGVGATGTWLDNCTLEITLGKNKAISVGGGYIVLNGLGITNGFHDHENNGSCNACEVVGQYFISCGELPEDELKAVDARVNEREDGSYLTVIFNKPTDMNTNIENVVCNMDLGTGATMVWKTVTKLEIKLGSDNKLKNGKDLVADAKVAFKNIKFANGLGEVVADEIDITGSFDGRETRLSNLVAEIDGDYTKATVTLHKQDLNFGKDAKAVVTFVVWNKEGTLVTDMNAMSIDMNVVNMIELQSTIATKDASKVDVYVTDQFLNVVDATAPEFKVLADAVSAEVAIASEEESEESEN